MSSDHQPPNFAELLRRHLTEGTRPTGRSGTWGRKQFASCVGVSQRLVGEWLSGTRPREIEPLVRALFGEKADVNANGDYAAFLKAYHAMPIRPSKVATPKLSADDTALRYERHLRVEFDTICDRVRNLSEPNASRSREKIFGWPWMLGLASPHADPKIAAAELRLRCPDFRFARIKPTQEERAKLLKDILTARYLVCCCYVACGLNYDRTLLFDPLLRGLTKQKPATEQQKNYLRDLLETLLTGGEEDRGEVCGAILYRLGREAALHGFTLDDFLSEELSPHRKIVKARHRLSDHHYKVTHKIEIFFTDTEGSYLKILQSLLSDTRLNFLMTSSATLSPGWVAKANLHVYFQGQTRDLDRKLKDLRNEHLLDRIILEISASEWSM